MDQSDERFSARLPQLRKVVSRVAGNGAPVDDIVQECCVHILVKGDLYRERGRLQQWLNAVARNFTVNWMAKDRAHRRRERDLMKNLSSMPRPEREFSEEQIAWILRQIPSLPPAQKEILRLRYFEGLGVVEIASSAGISHQAVSKSLDRSLETLRSRARVAQFLAALLPWNWDFNALWKVGSMGFKTKAVVSAGIVGTLYFGVENAQKAGEIERLQESLRTETARVEGRSAAKPIAVAIEAVETETHDASRGSIKQTEKGVRQPLSPNNTEQDSVLFSSALLTHARSEFLRGWRQERVLSPSENQVENGIEEFQKLTLALPAQLGKDAATAANEDDAAIASLQSGDGVGLLTAAKNPRFRIPREGFEELIYKCVARKERGSERDGETILDSWELNLQDGETIRFGPGVFKLDAQQLNPRNRPFPTDLTIEGAGKDLTLLQIWDIDSRTNINRLTLRNLTIDSECSAFDMRGPALIFTLDGVRLVGFDCGAGGSIAIDTSHGFMLRALNSEFLGGYGRTPEGLANLFRGGAVLASFSNCRLEYIDLNIDHMNAGGMMSFSGCTIIPKSEDLTQFSSDKVFFQNCRIEPPLGVPFNDDREKYLEALEKKLGSIQRDLADIFPQLRE